MKTPHNKPYLLILITLFLGILSPSLTNQVSADGWIGTGKSSVKGGGGGGGSGCDATAKTFRIDCAGVSWAYYEALEETNKNLSFPNAPSDYIIPVNKKISSSCSKHISGGFYHFGANAFGYRMGNWQNPLLWGHWLSLAYGDEPSYAPYISNRKGTPKHAIKDGNKVIYKFKEFKSVSEAKSAHKKAGGNGNIGGTWAFCYWEPEATVTIYAVDSYTGKYIGENKKFPAASAADALKKGGKVLAKKGKDITKEIWAPSSLTWKNAVQKGEDRMDKFTDIAGISTKKGEIKPPASSGNNRVSFNTSTREVTIKDITKDQDLYIHYRRKATITIYDVLYDENTKQYEYMNCSGTGVGLNRTSACTHKTKMYVGEKKSVNLNDPPLPSDVILIGVSDEFGKKGNLNKVTGNNYANKEPVTKDYIFYANYVKGDIASLRVEEITTGGRPLGVCGDGTKVVPKGGSASVTCPLTTNDTYTFSYFTDSSTGSRVGPTGSVSGRTYTERNITKQTTRYAVYTGGSTPPGVITPPDDNCDGGNALIKQFVKNTSIAAYNSWRESVYAKPKDNLVYCTSYNPNSPQGSGGWNYTNYEVADNSCSAVFPIGRAYSQRNDFLTKQSKGINVNAPWGGSTVFTDTGVPGSQAKRTHKNEYKNIPISDVGKTIDERGETYNNTPTSANAHTEKSTDGSTTRGKCVKWVCSGCYSYSCNCHSCNCTTSCSESGSCSTSCSTCCSTCYKDTYYHYSRGFPPSTTVTTSIAQAHVPYNFETATEITSPTDETNQIDPETGHHIVYAGETEEVRYTFDVNTRYNSTTDGDYATKIDDSRRQLEISYNGNTYYTNTDTEDLTNTSVGGMNSYSRNYSREIIIPDLPAGTEITVRSMVYPATSGPETNWTDKGGDHQWAYSEPVTYVIAKRPSLDVWGGNSFTNSAVSTSTATKYQLDGVTSYTPDRRNRNTAYLFGSWSELGMINNSTIQGMASGASLGKNYGSIESSLSYTKRIPLTFANYPNVTPLGQSAANNRFNRDRDNLLSKYFFEDTDVPDIEGYEPPLNDSAYDVGNNVFYYHNQSGFSISTNIINPGTTQVVSTESDVEITGDITYGGDINTRVNYLFGNFINIPKLIVYAKGKINISCNVNRIDAVLIAHEITTCADSSNELDEDIITDTANSNRLVIFGAVITDKLNANRTYGAEPGINGISSVSPAEIIIFDPTLYRLENNTDDASQTEAASADTKLVTTYIKELSPRF